MKDGQEIISKRSMDDIGHGIDPEPIATLQETEILELLNNVSNGKELMDCLNNHYKGMFEVFPPKKNESKKMYSDYNYEEMISITDFKQVSKIIGYPKYLGVSPNL